MCSHAHYFPLVGIVRLCPSPVAIHLDKSIVIHSPVETFNKVLMFSEVAIVSCRKCMNAMECLEFKQVIQ